MIRIIGFVIGSFLAVGALMALVGTPDFERRDGGDARRDAAIENLKRKWEEPAAEPATAAAVPPADMAGSLPADDDAPAGLVGPVGPVDYLPDTGDSPPAPPTVAASEPGWHAFWTPFKTEIAARGFIGRLEAVTGLDYRVTKLRTGAWQVAFAYRSDADVDAALEQIAAATGLDLASARP